ncbi:hypothetical protein D3C86_1974280 [compost metagenome]
MAVHQHVDALLHEGIGDLRRLKRQKASLAGRVRQLDRLGNQIVELVALVHERLAGHLERHQKLAEVELHHADEQRTQYGDIDRRHIHIHAHGATQQHAVHHDPESQHYAYQTA